MSTATQWHESSRRASSSKARSSKASSTKARSSKARSSKARSTKAGSTKAGSTTSRAEARTSAAEKLAWTGLRDRKAGGYSGVAEEDVAEPARTQRLLATPFSFHRAAIGDAVQAHEGFIMFRVNGSTSVGSLYRLIVVVANLCLGVLGGFGASIRSRSPSDPPGTYLHAQALTQAALVLTIQLAMTVFCLGWVPDADRVISLFAGMQFLMETLSTALLLLSSLLRPAPGSMADPAEGGGLPANSSVDVLPLIAFGTSLGAVAIPVVQLLEQRLATPTIIAVRNRGGDPVALMATAYMLASALPRMIQRLAAKVAGLEGGDGGGDGGGGGVEDEDAGGGGMSGGAGGAEDEAELGISADDAMNLGNKVTKLLSRGLAAKEAVAKEVKLGEAAPRPAAPGQKAVVTDVEDDDDDDGGADVQ